MSCFPAVGKRFQQDVGELFFEDGACATHGTTVIPAKAGNHSTGPRAIASDPRFHGNDRGFSGQGASLRDFEAELGVRVNLASRGWGLRQDGTAWTTLRGD